MTVRRKLVKTEGPFRVEALIAESLSDPPETVGYDIIGPDVHLLSLKEEDVGPALQELLAEYRRST